jgi:N-acetylglucosamine kinase-like BadF-type ATPase
MNTSPFGLGIDAGGTQTRWALANANDAIIADDAVAGLTALQMSTDAGRAHIRECMDAIVRALPSESRPSHISAGMTGFTERGDSIRALIASVFDTDIEAVALHSDIEIACLDLFAPGEGYVVYAGTGSIAAFIDSAGNFHRAGGRGAILDDAGGGFWIAIEALRHVWRGEDALPGSSRDSPMASELFSRIGGGEWAQSREFVYQRARGDIGMLALAVAATADKDPAAFQILQRAGAELARLGNAMSTRFGSRPMALAGRVAQLHPIIEQTMRAALPSGADLKIRTSDAHIAAARIAARAARVT